GQLHRLGLITYDSVMYEGLKNAAICSADIRGWIDHNNIGFKNIADFDAFFKNSLHYTENHDEAPYRYAFGKYAPAATAFSFAIPGYALLTLRQLLNMGFPAGVGPYTGINEKGPDMGVYAYKYDERITNQRLDRLVDKDLKNILRLISQPAFRQGSLFHTAYLEDKEGKELLLGRTPLVPVLRYSEEEIGVVIINHNGLSQELVINPDTMDKYFHAKYTGNFYGKKAGRLLDFTGSADAQRALAEQAKEYRSGRSKKIAVTLTGNGYALLRFAAKGVDKKAGVALASSSATKAATLRPVYHLTLNNHQPAGTEWSLRHYFESYLPVLAALALPSEDWNRLFPNWKNVERRQLKLNYSVSLSLSRELQDYARALVKLVKVAKFHWDSSVQRQIDDFIGRDELPQEIGLLLKPVKVWSDEDVKFVHTYFNFNPPHDGSITRVNNLCPQYKKIWPAFAQFYDECWGDKTASSMPWGGFVRKDFRTMKPSGEDKITAKALLLGTILSYFNRHLFAQGPIRLAGVIQPDKRHYFQYAGDKIKSNHSHRARRYFERAVDFTRFLRTDIEDRKAREEKEAGRIDKKTENHFTRLAKNQEACVAFVEEMTKALTIFPNLIALLSISDELAAAADKNITIGQLLRHREYNKDGKFLRWHQIGKISFSVTPHIIPAALMDQRQAMVDELGLSDMDKEKQDECLSNDRPWLYYHEKPLDNPKALSSKFQGNV
ncbi:MAG: hypothetical protein WC330_04410, partial [Candidatus Omnitrophota bacterium]